MKLLYLDCNMGAAGDMLMAALYTLLPDQQAFLDAMHGAGIPGLRLAPEQAASHGIAGTRMGVFIHGREEENISPDHSHPNIHEHDHIHSHAHGNLTPSDISRLLTDLALPETVRCRAKKVYDRITLAEAHVHGRDPGHVHFHELGSLDAVADVVGVCLAVEMLGAGRIVASPIRLGFGQVRCAHGLIPVPAPATAELLLGLPCYGGDIAGELCTPTGAALLAEIADAFGPMPDMCPAKIGCGLGKRDFGAPNCLRATLGRSGDGQRGEIVELVCNIDDMTPEALANAQAELLRAGALDAYLLPGVMKKGRPGHVLTVLCAPADEEKLARAVFACTGTIGLRVRLCGKYFLTPGSGEVETAYGTLKTKRAQGWGVSREKPEYDAAAALAAEKAVPLREISAAFRDCGHDPGHTQEPHSAD